MEESKNLNMLCRCCFSDKSKMTTQDGYTMYQCYLNDIFGIVLSQPPPPIKACHGVCVKCAEDIMRALRFRERTLAADSMFQRYCNTKQFYIDNNRREKECVAADTCADHELDSEFDDYYESLKVTKQESAIIKVEVECDVSLADPIGVQDNDNDVPVQNIVKKEELKEELTDESEDNKEELTDILDDRNKITPAIKTPAKKVPARETMKKTKKVRKKVAAEQATRHTSRGRQDKETRRKLLEAYLVQVKTNENRTSYTCRSCGGRYPRRQDIYKHIQLRHDAPAPHECEQCHKLFVHAGHLARHRQTHTTDIRCKYCEKTFTTKTTLKVHENSHTKQSVYQCDMCNKYLMYKASLRKHILQMHGEHKELLCDVCGRAFRQKSNLEAHIRTVHLKLRPYACTVCAKTYSAKKHLKNHTKLAHSGNPKPLQCDRCPRSFACAKSMKIHKLRHDNKFSCRYCSTIFDDKKDYETHVDVHAQDIGHCKSYSCHLCGKVLKTKFTLNRHVELHGGIKRYACPTCGMRFTQKALVKRHHKSIHDPDIKPEKTKCELCKKPFRNMQRHLESHSADAKKYSCELCGKSYTENNALNRHKNQKHFGVSHDCHLCGKKYINKRSLETHKFKVHKIKKEVVDSTAPLDDVDVPDVT